MRRNAKGQIISGPDIREPVERFWQKVSKTNSCWLWTGAINKGGYGTFFDAVRVVPAHQWAYKQEFGEPLPDMVLDHVCHNEDTSCRGGPSCQHRRCVNPDHLRVTTILHNIQAGRTGLWRRMLTACPRGHEYTPENTRIYRRGRHCRACDRLRYHEGRH